MMQRILCYVLIFLFASFVLEETIAKPSTGTTDSKSVLQCANTNYTNINHLICCNDLSTNEGICAVFSNNGDEIEALINGVRTTINASESTCTPGSGSSSEVCLDVKTFDKQQLCFSLSSKSGYQSNTVCASLPALHVNGASAVNRRDMPSSQGDLLKLLIVLGGEGGPVAGLERLLRIEAVLNSLPANLTLSDLSKVPALSSLTGSIGNIAILNSILSLLRRQQ